VYAVVDHIKKYKLGCIMKGFRIELELLVRVIQLIVELFVIKWLFDLIEVEGTSLVDFR